MRSPYLSAVVMWTLPDRTINAVRKMRLSSGLIETYYISVGVTVPTAPGNLDLLGIALMVECH
jgi:hypothetical protein